MDIDGASGFLLVGLAWALWFNPHVALIMVSSTYCVGINGAIKDGAMGRYQVFPHYEKGRTGSFAQFEKGTGERP